MEVFVYDEDRQGKPPALLSVATVLLTPAQVQRLDNLLTFYRRESHLSSTTTNTIHLRWEVKGEKPRWEKFRDQTSYSEDFADAHPDDIRLVVEYYCRLTDTVDMRRYQKPSHKFGIFATQKPLLSLVRVFSQAKIARENGLKEVFYRDTVREETNAYKKSQQEREKQRYDQLVQRLEKASPHRPEALQTFEISPPTYEAAYFARPYSGLMHLVCTPRESQIIDSIHWINPVIKWKSQYSWGDFMIAYRRLQRRLEDLTWLEAWKQVDVAHVATVEVYGHDLFQYGHFEIENEPDEEVVRAFRKSKMTGRPAYIIHLYAKEASYFRASVWLSSDLRETRALVQVYGFGSGDAKDKNIRKLPSARSWFGGADAYFGIEKGAEFLIITAQGAATTHRF
jgi:hypothetical protein